MNWLKAGALYFLLLFALGVLLGVVRIGLLIPLVGATWALAVELPIMLLAAWFICRKLMRKIHVPRSLRLATGACYLLLLLLAEMALGALVGRMPGSEAGPLALAGLLAQFATALFPRLQARR